MGDTTHLELYLYDCPPARVAAVYEAMEAAGLRVGWDGPFLDPCQPLRLGLAYTNRRACGDAPRDLATGLIDAAPRVSFLAWTVPAHDGLGVLLRYTPALGRHESGCNTEGCAEFHPTQIVRAVREGHAR